MDKNTPLAVKVKVIDMIMDRTDGKATQQIDMVADVSDRNRVDEIKGKLDNLTLEEREQYLELCEKMTEGVENG